MKKIVLLLTACILGYTASAQEKTAHEFSFNLAGGLSTLLYSPAIGSHSNGAGLSFGLGYTYNFSDNWGIVTGLDLAFYNSSFKANALTERYQLETPPTIVPTPPDDGANTAFYVNGEYTNYEESQSAMYLNIPVMAQFSLPMNNNAFYAAAGVKIGLPLSTTYDAKADKLTTFGESSYTGQTYYDNHGFKTQNNLAYDGDWDASMSCMLALEAGMKWKLAERWNIYTGVYFDYGLTNISNSSNNPMVVYESSETYSYNSALQSPANGVNVDKINNMAIGVKVKIAFK